MTEKTGHLIEDYTGLTPASRKIGRSVETIRRYADNGKIRSIRDPQNRRLLLREDVERLAAERNAK